MARKKRTRESQKTGKDRQRSSKEGNDSNAKGRSNRRDKFARQRFNSWLWFIGKISMFVIPIMGITTWMIVQLLLGGSHVPILTLDYSNAENRTEDNWYRLNFTLASNEPLELRDPDANGKGILKFGGPQKDVIFVYADVLGDVRMVEDRPVPCIFIANDLEEHDTQAYVGLTETETESTANQWVPVEDFLKKILAGIEQNVESSEPGKIVFVLDVDHPDLPARLPPELNQFAAKCKERWPTFEGTLSAHNVFLWLSHSPGQKSYLGSDPQQVESFFKKRFELAITGDVLDLGWEEKKEWIGYQQVKDYILRWVESDAAVHLLAQTPMFLEPQGFSDAEDFPVIEFDQRPADTSANGRLFDYYQRSLNPQLDQNWKKLAKISEDRSWGTENPLLQQRSWMLLLQMEKLWYRGLDRDRQLFKALASQLSGEGGIFELSVAIDPFRHTLAEEVLARDVESPPALDLDLVSNTVKGLDPDSTEVAKELQQRKYKWQAWQQDHSNWNGELALSCWLALTPETASFGRQEIVDILKALESHPNQVSQVFRAATTQSVKPDDVNWNEIGFLKRLASDDELIWPENQNRRVAFEKIVQLSIRARHLSNLFAAKLSAPLTNQFSASFEKLEQRRRLYEDKLFAHDTETLGALYSRLLADYGELGASYNEVLKQFKALQYDLLLAPHELRYAIQSTIVADQYVDVADNFKQWLTNPEGFADRWKELGGQKIEAVVGDPKNQPTQKFEVLRENLLPELEVTIADEQKRLATNAWKDQKWISEKFSETNSNVEFMSVNDGNLLARRLLLWPGLRLEQRMKIHKGLSQENHVNPSGEADGNVPFRNKSTAQRLNEILNDRDVAINFQLNSQPMTYNPNNLVEGDEDFFIQVAHGAHRQLITSQANDQSSKSMASAVNDFRRRKSNFDFLRVKNDLWGTPRVRGRSYVEAALENQINVVGFRVSDFKETVFQQTVRETWDSGKRNLWSGELDLVRKFAEGYQRFQWQREEQKATNSTLAQVMGPNPDQMVFSIYPQRQSEAVRPSTFSVPEAELDTKAFQGQAHRQLTIYLRGHVRNLPVLAAASPPRQKVIPVSPELGRVSFAKLIVQRDKIGPSAGHVTFVIDCSNSMSAAVSRQGKATSRMDRLKEDLVEFLKEISQRGDISVSLLAFGATESWKYRFSPARKHRPANALKRWRRPDPDKDVWAYRENGEPVTHDNIAALVKAIQELEPHGETPMLGGLESALELTKDRQQNLVVLLTDGFQFNNRNLSAEESKIVDKSFDPSSLYPKISDKLLKDSSLEMAVFSYLANVIGHVDENGLEQNETQLRKYLSQHFGEMIEQEFPPREIVRRVRKIESLADKNKVRHRLGPGSTTLKEFLDDLLPKPIVEAYDDEKELLSQLIKYPKQRDKPVMSKDLNKDELPVGRWRLEIKYSQPKLKFAANGFARVPAPWTTELPLVGNERLVFLYDPFRPSLVLTSGELTGDTKTVSMSGRELLVQSVPQATRRSPEFALVAAEGNRLTPAPKFALAQLQSNNNPNNSLMLQDFHLPRQTSSNVHRVVFPMIREDLRTALFGDQAAGLKLRLLAKIPPQLWHPLELGTADQPQTISSEGSQVDLPAEDWGNIATLMPQNKRFADYRFLLRRINRRGETARYTLRIESETLPLDQWLVNIVNDKGEVDRFAISNRSRRYTFLDDFQAKPKLIRIEHEFDIELNRFQSQKLFLGVANVNDLGQTSDVSYDEYFRAR